MNLIDTNLKNEISSAMDDLFDTFKKSNQVRFYKMPEQAVIVADSNYNPDFDEFSVRSNIVQEAVYSDFDARIWYEDRQEFSTIVNGGEDPGIRIKQFYNRVKIQVKEDAFNYLKDSIKFVIFDEEYKISESWRRIGFLDTFNRYQVILQRVN